MAWGSGDGGPDERNGSAFPEVGRKGTQKYERLGTPDIINVPSSPTSGSPPSVNKYAVMCAVLASLNSILLGYDAGIMSGAVQFIKDDLKITDRQVELLVGSMSIVSLVGSASAGRIADAVGRRWAMVTAQFFFLVGALVLGAAPSFAWLMVGRVICGIGVGFALMIAPVYTAELSPASIRGSLVSLPEISINLGILLGFICSYILSGLPKNVGWRLMLAFGGVPSIFLIAAVMLMLESPRWLVMRKRYDEAEVVLIKTSSSKEEARMRLGEIIAAAGLTRHPAEETTKSSWPDQGIVEVVSRSEQVDTAGQGVWREFIFPTPAVRRMLILSLGIQFFQQSTGIDATVYYSWKIFNGAGIPGKPLGPTIAIGVSKTVFILVATVLLDRMGRRPLLLFSITGMTVSLASLAIGFKVLGVTNATGTNGGAPSPSAASQGSGIAPVLAVIGLCSYVGLFSIGMGPVNWVLTSEVFPSRLRAQAMGLGIAVNRLASGVVSLGFISLVDAIDYAGAFALFASMGFLGIVFVYFVVPETKGKSLEDIFQLFETQDTSTPPPSFLELRNLNGMEDSEDRVVDSEAAFPHQSAVEEEKLTLIADDFSNSSLTLRDPPQEQLPKN